MATAHTPAPSRNDIHRPMAQSQRAATRRTQAQDSVSLPRHKKQKLSHSPDDQAVSISQPTGQEVKSQESGSDQSASNWFDKANEHIDHSGKTNNYDDEPPFFMADRKNYVPRDFETTGSSVKIFGSHSRLDSENEELRGVIDDLTVENKQLKHILRTVNNHRTSPSSGSQDKLFEVRMHGLPPEKRRELEFLLKNFATSVHHTNPSLTRSTSGSGESSHSMAGNKLKTDSGYISNSNSSQTPHGASRTLPTGSKRSRDKSIKSYLHDIPDTLLPRQNLVNLSDRAKMALVVRRLEQLFTGKSAAPGEHSQPLQQQEVSNMAARADAKNSKKRRAEGTREAHILPHDSKVNLDAMDAVAEKRSQSTQQRGESFDVPATEILSSISRPGSPDQRPTRPLDLDIHRAQVAAENLQYLRHLGLSSQHTDSAGDEREGTWLYLNLLINMAQLHTVNVTRDFIRRAIKKLSTKFEFSKDGHKIRWIGGDEGTNFSKEDEQALENIDPVNASSTESSEDVGAGSSSKRSKTDSNSNAVVSTSLSDGKTSQVQTNSESKPQVSTTDTSYQQSLYMTKPIQSTGSAFDYKPIVYQGRVRVGTDQFSEGSNSSYGGMTNDSTKLVHALSNSNLNQPRNSDEGLITFFNNPHFCSDYSGDNMPRNMLHDRPAVAGDVLGVPVFMDRGESALRYGDACYFAPQFGPAPIQPSHEDKFPTLNLFAISEAGEPETRPMELPCSGIGHMTPEDNFAIDVRIARATCNSQNGPVLRKIPFTGRAVKASYVYKGETEQKIDLLPSAMPPPSYIFFMSSSSSGNPDMEDSESDSEESSSTLDEEYPAPPAFLQRWSAGSSGDIMDEGDDGDLDSSSVDMLAIARAADPAMIAEQERQYMITLPGGRAVAGSLAATVGASRSSVSNRYAGSDAAAAGTDEDNGADTDSDDSMDSD